MSEHPPQGRPSRLRRWLALLTLLLTLLAINIAYPAVADQPTVLEGEAGAALYVAGFDAFADEWQQNDGRNSHQVSTDGTMRIDVQTDSVIFSAAQPHFRDFDASVSARAVAGSENNAYGLIFRLQQASSGCTLSVALLCGLSDVQFFGLGNWVRAAFEQQQATRYYMFLISSDGFYSVWRGDDAGPRELSNWIPSDAINLGLDADNRIRVVGRGDAFQFFINGTPVELCLPNEPDAQSLYYLGECLEGRMSRTLQDDGIATGQLALVVVTSSALNLPPGVVVDFDNVVVLSPASSEQEPDRT